jgi:hypothetical protein
MIQLTKVAAHALPAALLSLLSITCVQAQVRLAAGSLQLELNAGGAVTAIRNTASGRDYLYAASPAPLLTLVSAGVRRAPAAMAVSRSRADTRLTLDYADPAARIVVRVRELPTHLAFDIVSATPERLVDAVIWGPYPTTISKTVGEVIGVVRDGQVSLGLQVLNMKTLGGDLPNSEGSTWARGIAATAYPWGSSLQAYAINRNRKRRVDAWGGNQKNMPVDPIPGETVVGSAIALFSCAESETLDRLEQIEIAEHLPHPTIDGVWSPRSPIYGRSYMISSFGEADVDEMLVYAKRAGLYSLYHEGPFRSWGHFVLSESQWPNGRAGMKRAVDKAHAVGLHFGVHTLTNFINTNDPYVTPVPDERLSITGQSTLVRGIDSAATVFEVASPDFFSAGGDTNILHTARIGRELVQYDSVSQAAPWRLLGAARGAFGTKASAHAAGSVVGKLFDHPYKVFFPNFAMQREVARNLADFLNETGADHIDFDGHEGALASGQGDYALAVFADDVIRGVKHDLINGTSTSKTFYWHIGSYYNWGEPWYGGFRESMQQYRIDNQALFDRNYMPHMLGWYLLTDSTTLAEMEWMLARAASYNAGFAMVARPGALRANPRTPMLLDAIREWETARTSGAFTEAQQLRLRDATREFHLATTGAGAWRLSEYGITAPLVRERVERQPGEPTASSWQVAQDWDMQRLQFTIVVPGKTGSARNFRLQVDRMPESVLTVTLAAGESIVCDSGDECAVMTAAGTVKTFVRPTVALPVTQPGAHTITLDTERGGDDAPKVVLQLRGVRAVDEVRRP